MTKLDNKLRNNLKIQNVVCTADLAQPVTLEIFNKFEFLEANLELYPCGYVKNKQMIGRVTVFASGKLISVGTKSVSQAKKELKIAHDILEKYDLISKSKIIPQVRNIVARFVLNEKVKIEKLARIMPKCIYEPEQFPGLIYTIQNSLVALIFASGKGVLVGGKSISEINQGLFEVEKWIK